LIACRTEDALVERIAMQEACHLAALVRRAKHHNAPEPFGSMARDVGTRDQTAHGMADEVNLPGGSLGQAGNARANFVDEALDVLFSRGIVDVEGREVFMVEGPLDLVHARGCSSDPAQKYDGI
jgi:hypothetical protein